MMVLYQIAFLLPQKIVRNIWVKELVMMKFC